MINKYCKLNIIELSDEKVPDKINESIENEIKEKTSKKKITKKEKEKMLFNNRW